MRFTGIITQGASRMGTAEFIKAFKVASSLDGRTYTMYRPEGQSKDLVIIRSFILFYFSGCLVKALAFKVFIGVYSTMGTFGQL